MFEYFMRNIHSTLTRSSSLHDHTCLCGSGNKDSDMEHFKMMGGGNVSNPSGAKDDDSFLSDDAESGAGCELCVAHSVFHLSFTEEKFCNVCRCKNNEGQLVNPESPRYLNFWYICQCIAPSPSKKRHLFNSRITGSCETSINVSQCRKS